MKILVAAFAYNERPYIPYMVEYYRSQGCDLLILDNYSTDGTYEWLKENEVDVVRVDTDDSFHLIRLQKAMLRELRRRHPDWFIYTGVDTYFYLGKSIRKEIEIQHNLGFNKIVVTRIEAYNTGEKFLLPFQENYFYVRVGEKREMIVRYDRDDRQFCFRGDRVYISNPKLFVNGGFLINYGMCKSKEEREETFARRQRAWALGNPKGHGIHYAPAQERNWIWEKENLTDIRTTEFYTLMK